MISIVEDIIKIHVNNIEIAPGTIVASTQNPTYLFRINSVTGDRFNYEAIRKKNPLTKRWDMFNSPGTRNESFEAAKHWICRPIDLPND